MFDNDTITINKDCFVGCMKDLYCPKKFDPDTLSFDQVRALTIGKKSSVSITGQTTKDPKRWLPPESAIRRLADIVQLQIDYLLIEGFHEKELPDLSSGLPWQRLSGEKRWPHWIWLRARCSFFIHRDFTGGLRDGRIKEERKWGHASGWCQKETTLNINTCEEITNNNNNNNQLYL